MPSNTRNMFLLITLVFGGSMIFFAIVPESLLPLKLENESSKILHPKFNSHAKKLLASDEKKRENLDGYTTLTVTKNSILPSDGLKTYEGAAKAMLHVKSFRGRFRRHARKKLNTKDSFLPWKFNLNVSRLHTQNAESQSKERITSPELRMEKPGKHLEIALHVKGNDLDDSYSEMHHAWDSVENFLRQLFGGNIEELSERGHSVFVDLNGLPSKVHAGERMKSFVNDEAGNQEKDNEGKFLFGLFGQGGNSENPPMDQGNEEVLENIPTTKSPLVISAPADDLQQATTTEILDDFTHVHQLEEPVATEESKVLDIVSKERFTTEETKMFSTHLTESNNQDSLLAPSLSHNDLSVTQIDEPETSTVATQNKRITESAINEDDFIEFCIFLLHRLKKSPRLLEEFNNLEGSGSVGLEENGTTSVEATSHGHRLTESISQPEPQNMGFLASLLNRITGGRTWQEQSSTSIEQSNDMIENENGKAKTININNNNLFINFGSGISTELDGFENIKFDDIDLKATQNTDTGVFTASDCKVFFRHIQSTNFPTESNILKGSTQIERILPNLKEDLSLDEKSTSFTTENLQDIKGDRSFNELLDSDLNLKLENTEGNDLSFSSIRNLGSETNTGLSVEKADGTFNVLSLGNSLNVGSGTSKLPAEKKELVLRTFLKVRSGGKGISEDFLNDQSTENQFSFTTASPDLRIFPGFFNFGSGERNFGESFQFETSNAPDITTDKDERTFVRLLGIGSGGGQIQEEIESLSSDFSTNDVLNFEDGNVRKLSIQDRYKEINLGAKSYETDSELAGTIDMLQARKAKEDVRANSDVLERQDALISATETDQQNRRLIRFQSVSSGDGRYIENEISVPIDETNSGCSVICTIENGTDSFIKCTECPLEFSKDIPLEAVIETSLDSAEPEIALGLTSSNVEYADIKPVNMPKNYQTDESSKIDLKDKIANHVAPSTTDGTISPTSRNETKTKESTLTEKIFLTINDENGQINLVQDTESALPSSRSFSPRFAARKGRLTDDSFDSNVMEPDDFENSFQELKTLDNSTEPFLKDIVQAFKQTDRSEGEIIASLLPMPVNQKSSKHITTNSPALVTDLTGTNIQRRFGSEPRYCTSHDQCDKSLNEQCTSTTYMGICDCGLFFVRHSVTGKCEEPFRVKTQLRFPREAFRKVLKDESSDYFHKMRKDSVKTMRLLIGPDSYLKDALVKVEVDGFEEGSLVVNYDLTFAKEQNKSLVEFILRVNTVVTEALKNVDMVEKTPLNIVHAQLVSMGTFAHRCDAKELNYCSVNAKCIPVDDKFTCQCNDGYLDNSREGYDGEVCEEYCPPDYCGNNGYCDMKFKGEKFCLCSDWYFGERCEIPGLLLIVGFLVLNIALVLIILGIICICRKMRHRKTRHYKSVIPTVNANGSFGRLTHASPRLHGAVALNEMELGGATKYVSKNTPVHRIPVIDVRSPSVGGSSNSYDFDSTFDRSASIEDQNKTVAL